MPDLCNDGHDAPCVTGTPGGLAQADAFLARWVPKIMAAPAYRDGGLIVITFDEGSDAAACCGETSGFSADHPNVPVPGRTGPGGGRLGAVLLSPLIKPGTVSTVPYNHYSLLRTIEDIFGLPHLGNAAMPQVRSFGPDVLGSRIPRRAVAARASRARRAAGARPRPLEQPPEGRSAAAWQAVDQGTRASVGRAAAIRAVREGRAAPGAPRQVVAWRSPGGPGILSSALSHPRTEPSRRGRARSSLTVYEQALIAASPRRPRSLNTKNGGGITDQARLHQARLPLFWVST